MNLNNLPPHTAIITANHRLATYLRRQYDASQQVVGRMVWETIDCLALDQWLARCYRDLPQAGLLLNHTQALVVWEQIIVASFSGEQEHLAFLSPRALATTALTAWHTLQQWQTPLSALANAPSLDVQTFYRWATQFAQLCRQANWLDSSMATAQLIAAISKIPLPKHIVLAGFLTDTELAPQTRHLFAVLQQHSDVQIYQPGIAETSVQQRVGLPDVEQELYAMAQWARDTHLQHPDKTIGCVIPNLTTTRDNVERIFTQVFTANNTQQLPAPNISGGSPLYHCPLIQSAFDLLALSEVVGRAVHEQRAVHEPPLHSPFVRGDSRIARFNGYRCGTAQPLVTLTILGWRSTGIYCARYVGCVLA